MTRTDLSAWFAAPMRWVVVVAVVAFLAAAGPVLAACGSEQVEVEGSAEETVVACGALAEVRAYFADIGFVFEPRLRVSFMRRVEIRLPEGRRLRVSSCFDGDRGEIELVTWRGRPADERRPWGLQWNRQTVSSIAVHEMTHAALWHILAEDRARLGPAWHEFVAYVVQFELMPERTRGAVLARFRDALPFEDPANVNAFLHALDPDLFGLKSYLFARDRGARGFVRDLLSGRVDFDTRGVDPGCL